MAKFVGQDGEKLFPAGLVIGKDKDTVGPPGHEEAPRPARLGGGAAKDDRDFGLGGSVQTGADVIKDLLGLCFEDLNIRRKVTAIPIKFKMSCFGDFFPT
jgi:hypothetical protein